MIFIQSKGVHLSYSDGLNNNVLGNYLNASLGVL